MSSPRPPRRIVIVRLSHLGDVVHALPVYHALSATHPRAEIAWVVQEEFAGLLEGLPGLAEIFLFGRRAGVRAWPRLWSQLRAFAPDWAIDAQGNVKSALVTLGSGAARRSGMHPSDWTEPFGSGVLTDSAPATGRGVHALERMRALARHVAPEAPWRTDPGLAAHEIVEGRERARHAFGAQDSPAILHLSPPDDVRSWPSAHFEELARELARDRPVVLVSGPGVLGLGAELARRLPEGGRVTHWIGQRGLRELCGFLRASAERGGVFVGCDSGPLHLAAASGLRVVCLAGPQDERRTGPWPLAGAAHPNGAGTLGGEPSPLADRARGPLHRAVRSREVLACAPCLARRCRHPRGPVCMSGIGPDDVLAALR